MSPALAVMCLAAAVSVAPPARAQLRHAALHAGAGSRRPAADPQQRSRVWVVATLVPLTLAYLAGGLGALLAAVILGATLLRRARRAAVARCRAAQRQSLLDGLDVVIAELRIGAHPAAAAAAAATECAGDAARALAIGAARSRLGGSAADGLRDVESVVHADLARLAGAWRLAEQHGLALADLLAANRTDLVGRIRFGRRTEAVLAGARASGAVLAGLPVLGILLGEAMGAAPMRVLLGGGVGGVLLALGAGFVAVGLIWTDAITGRVIS